MLVYIAGFALLALIVAGMVHALAGRRERYASMTEEELEAEARRSSLAGAGMRGLERIFDPKKAEFLLQQDKRAQGSSGDQPDTSGRGATAGESLSDEPRPQAAVSSSRSASE